MMQPSLPPSPKTASSVYEAIKDSDWEGLIALYATTAYDAVHSEDFAHQGRVGTAAAGVGFYWYTTSSPPSLAGDGPLRRGSFHEGEIKTKRKISYLYGIPDALYLLQFACSYTYHHNTNFLQRLNQKVRSIT